MDSKQVAHGQVIPLLPNCGSFASKGATRQLTTSVHLIATAMTHLTVQVMFRSSGQVQVFKLP